MLVYHNICPSEPNSLLLWHFYVLLKVTEISLYNRVSRALYVCMYN